MRITEEKIMSKKIKYNLCKDNVICCDENCQACAQRIYEKYMEEVEHKTMYDWLKRNYPEHILASGATKFCPWLNQYGLIGAGGYNCDKGSCDECWNRPFRGVNHGQG